METQLEDPISQQIAALPGLGKKQLGALWHEHCAKSPPPHLRKELMVPLLAYRIQEKEYGGLSHTARKKLRRLADSLPKTRKTKASFETSVDTGSRPMRSWLGEMHEVNVTNSGFEYRGQIYTSLSKVACVITGTRWSGPLFFGTKKVAK